MKGHSNEKALKRFDKSLQHHMNGAVRSIKDQSAFSTYYFVKKDLFSIMCEEPNVGLEAGRDYGPWMPEEEDVHA